MSENTTPMSREINAVGKSIRDDTFAEEGQQRLNSYRSLHIPIMRALATVVRNKKLKPKITARRLKRFSSIEKKLKRFPTMRLSQMQDIAGVRAVFDNIKEVYDFASDMRRTYKNQRNFKFLSDKDYIGEPKPDGYRSIHQIFTYQKGQFEQESKGLSVELQIRTLLQHYWATAVEILSFKTSSNLKLGEGEEYYKEFFRLCSALIAHQEKTPIHNDYKELNKAEIIHKIAKLDQEHNILKNLSALTLTSKNIQADLTNKGFYYYVMELNLDNNTLAIRGYKKNEVDRAKSFYSMLEHRRDENNIDVVLISIDKVKQLKSAYPNYFLDSKKFIRFIEKHYEALDKALFPNKEQ